MKEKIKLGINIDHVATLRNARDEDFPNIIRVSKKLREIKVDSITVHLREDRRHIRDQDVMDLKSTNLLPLNLEMAATNEMKKICLKTFHGRIENRSIMNFRDLSFWVHHRSATSIFQGFTSMLGTYHFV